MRLNRKGRPNLHRSAPRVQSLFERILARASRRRVSLVAHQKRSKDMLETVAVTRCPLSARRVIQKVGAEGLPPAAMRVQAALQNLLTFSDSRCCASAPRFVESLPSLPCAIVPSGTTQLIHVSGDPPHIQTGGAHFFEPFRVHCSVRANAGANALPRTVRL